MDMPTYRHRQNPYINVAYARHSLANKKMTLKNYID